MSNIDLKRRTKIVATIGPATQSEEIITDLIKAGVTTFRLNFSHGDHKDHQERIETIRKVSKKLELDIGILQDLQGPKIRVGTFQEGAVDLSPGSIFTFDSQVDQAGTAHRVSISNPEIYRVLEPGMALLLDDGKIRLRVEEDSEEKVKTTVEVGGVLSDHKGLNLPGAILPMTALTDKDRADLRFGLDLGVDWVALSFVQRPEDIAEARRLIAGRAGILCKMEKPTAIEHLEQIIQLTDAIMVARGDLGVEAPPEDVPGLQKKIIQAARTEGKPVIVATQMLESMISSARPTRAEVTDVAYAVNSGADAVMLSGETAVGAYPIETAVTMDRIARQVEAQLNRQGMWGRLLDHQDSGALATVIADATSHMSKALSARGIFVISQSGISAITVSNARPAAPIVAITNSDVVFRQMALMWGVVPVMQSAAGVENPNELARQVADALSLASSGEVVLLVRGFHDEPILNLPSVTVVTI